MTEDFGSGIIRCDGGETGTASNSDKHHCPKPKPARINKGDCGWCGRVSMRGPFKHPDYDTPWYLCDYCAENVEPMEPAPEFINLKGYANSVVVKVGGDIVARYPEGTFRPLNTDNDRLGGDVQ